MSHLHRVLAIVADQRSPENFPNEIPRWPIGKSVSAFARRELLIVVFLADLGRPLCMPLALKGPLVARGLTVCEALFVDSGDLLTSTES
jgi:hypothetical protein